MDSPDFANVISSKGTRLPAWLRRGYPCLVLLAVLLVFVYPVFIDKTLTNYSDFYVLPPWNLHQPAGWYHSSSVDGTPIYLLHSSDLLHIELLKKHQFLAWNPYVGFGAPWLAGMQSASYFPPKFIAFLWPNYWIGADVMRVVLFLLAGIGTYLLVASMGVRREAALFSGLSYMLCERLFMIVNMAPFHIETLLPLMLFAIHEMVKAGSLRHAALAAVIGGAQFLGGFPETSFVFGVVAALFFVFALFLHCNDKRSLKTGLALGLLVALLSLCIGGFQLAEFVRYAFLSTHTHSTTYGLQTKTPVWLLAFLLPNFFGDPFQPQWYAGLHSHDHMLTSTFCGISTILLAIVALLAPQSSLHRKYLWFFAGIFVVFAGYDFGLPVFKEIGRLPLFDLSSIAWNAFLIPHSVSVLAGFGMQALLERSFAKLVAAAVVLYAVAVLALCSEIHPEYFRPMMRGLAPLVVVIPAFVAAAWLLRHPKSVGAGVLVMLSLVSAELYFCDRKLKYLHFYEKKLRDPSSLSWLSKHVGHERIFGIGGVYAANLTMPRLFRDIRHVDAMYPAQFVDYAEAIWPDARSSVYRLSNLTWKNVDDPLLEQAAVRYIVMPRRPEESEVAMETLRTRFTQVYSDADVLIYQNDRALPRARFVASAMPAPGGFTATDLKNKLRDMPGAVYLEGYEVKEPSPCAGTGPVSIEYIADEPNQVRLRVSAPCRGFVVLADMYYPGWEVRVDGEEATMYRANYAFRAVEVREGTQDIEFSYRPWTLQLGVPVALLAWACAGSLLLLGVRFDKKRAS